MGLDAVLDQDTNEVVVDFIDAPEPEGEKPPAEEKKPPLEQKPPAEQPPAKEGEQTKEPKKDDDVEKLKKDLNKLGYNLRMRDEQLSFLQAQIEAERTRGQQTELDKTKNRKLAEIEHLKDTDTDSYIRERDRIIEEYYTTRMNDEKKAKETSEVVGKKKATQNEVAQRLMTDFPEVADVNSELFKEARSIITSRYTDEEAGELLATSPKTYYSIVSEASKVLEIKKLKTAPADADRKDRVGSQGVVNNSQPKPNEGTVKLDKTQLEFCKKHGYDPKAYAKHVAMMRSTS